MTTLLLLRALKTFLADGLADFYMEAPDKVELSRPSVFLGALPPKVKDEEAFPFAILRWDAGEDHEDRAEETVEIILGVYAADGPEIAEEWAVSLASRIRRLLRDNPILDQRYELQFPVSARKPDPKRQQNQYHLATIRTTWRISAPEQPMEKEEHDGYYPEG